MWSSSTTSLHLRNSLMWILFASLFIIPLFSPECAYFQLFVSFSFEATWEGGMVVGWWTGGNCWLWIFFLTFLLWDSDHFAFYFFLEPSHMLELVVGKDGGEAGRRKASKDSLPPTANPQTPKSNFLKTWKILKYRRIQKYSLPICDIGVLCESLFWSWRQEEKLPFPNNRKICF